MHPGSRRYSSLAYDEYAALLAPRDPGALAPAVNEAGDRWLGAVVIAVAAFLVSAVLPSPALAQCAMCKATLENSASSLGETFNRAILVMMAGPYLVMGVFGLAFFRERLREKARRLLARLRRAGPGRAR